MARISAELQNAVRCAPVRQYRLAHQINVHPSTLSGWLNGIVPVTPDDPRIVQLGALVGVPADACFDAADEGTARG